MSFIEPGIFDEFFNATCRIEVLTETRNERNTPVEDYAPLVGHEEIRCFVRFKEGGEVVAQSGVQIVSASHHINLRGLWPDISSTQSRAVVHHDLSEGSDIYDIIAVAHTPQRTRTQLKAKLSTD